jgi:hypothetical protein
MGRLCFWFLSKFQALGSLQDAEERAEELHKMICPGGRLGNSSSSAECTKIEHATDRYSASQPPCRPMARKQFSDDTAPAADTKGEQSRKARRDFALWMQVKLDSSSGEAPSPSRSAVLREIHSQIDYNAKLHSQIDYITKILRNAGAHCHCQQKRAGNSRGSSPAFTHVATE